MQSWFGAWVEAERGRFILFLPVAMAAAILVYFDLNAEPPLWLGCFVAAASLTALAALWRWPQWRILAALALAASCGFGRAEWRTAAEPPLITVPYGAVTVAGRISLIDTLPEGRRITVTTASLDSAAPLARALRLRLRNDDSTALNVGDSVALKAMLFRAERPAFPGGWDFGRDAFFEGLGASGFALTDVTVTRTSAPDTLTTRLCEIRRRIAARIMLVLPVATGSVAVTLLTGFEAAMPAAERQNFVTAGLAHILAVAGLHVGIVIGLFFAAFQFVLARFEPVMLRLRVKAVAAGIALAAGCAYAALTGAHLPILRSLAMASLVTCGVIAGRRAISLRGLALAALLLMLWMPETVIGVSFQMSFSAVLALIAGYAAVQARFARFSGRGFIARRLAGHVAALFYTSLLAGGASMPFAAYQFQQIQPYWIPANLVAVPLTALWIMPLGLLALALMPIGLSALALVPMGWGIAIMIRLTQIIAAWPDALLPVAHVPAAAILLYAAGLAWLGLWRSRLRFAGFGLMLAGLLACFLVRPPDVLVSPDAKLIAIRAGSGVTLLRQPKSPAYTLAQWRFVWPGAAFDTVHDGELPLTVQVNGEKLLLAATPFAGGCGGVILVVSPQPLHDLCHGPALIDRFSVWQDGAIAAWLGPHGVKILSDKAVQGSRPWVPEWPEWNKW